MPQEAGAESERLGGWCGGWPGWRWPAVQHTHTAAPAFPAAPIIHRNALSCGSWTVSTPGLGSKSVGGGKAAELRGAGLHVGGRVKRWRQRQRTAAAPGQPTHPPNGFHACVAQADTLILSANNFP